MEPIDLSQKKKRWSLWRALLILLTAVVLGTHAYHAWMRFLPGSPTTQLPFANTDHPLQFYYGQLTRQFIQNRGAFWGYDPAFMAGYAKSLIFPTSGTLPDLVAIVSGSYGAWTYNLISTFSVLLTPIFLAFAVVVLTRSWYWGALAFVLGVHWTWCAWPNVYVEWGMGPFILTSAMSVLGAAFLTDWLDGSGQRGWFAGTVISTIAVILHPLSLITLVLMLVPAYLIRIRSLDWRRHGAMWSVPLVIAVCWAPWWLPAVMLRETYGTSAVGFVNENVRERMDELLQGKYPEELVLLVAAVLTCPVLFKFDTRRTWCLFTCGTAVFGTVFLGAVLHWEISIKDCWQLVAVLATVLLLDASIAIARQGDARAGMLFGGAISIFALAYFGGAAEWLWRLQPGRFTQPLYALLVVEVSVASALIATKLRERPWMLNHYQALLSLIVTGLVGATVVPRGIGVLSACRDITPMSTDLPKEVHDIISIVKDVTDDSGRILFEDRGRLSLGDSDPFGSDINPSALLPILAPGQYIGGPYLYTNLKTNFTQFGDERLFGVPVKSLDLITFDQYATLYNVRWMVCWSKPMVRLAELYPDYFRFEGQSGELHLYTLNRGSNWAVSGRAQVQADPDRLEVSNAAADESGNLVLSYHWLNTLKSTANIRPVLLANDPAPFIAVDHAPAHFVIENRLW